MWVTNSKLQLQPLYISDILNNKFAWLGLRKDLGQAYQWDGPKKVRAVTPPFWRAITNNSILKLRVGFGVERGRERGGGYVN